MGQTVGVNVAKRANDVNISPQFDGYSAVRIYVGTDKDGNDIVYEAGNVNGRVLEIQNPFGTQEMANNILSDIRGYQYQPLSANNALLDPSSEMGDGVTVNGVYTGIYVCSTQFGRLMASNVSAPADEEIAHEYSVESASSDKEFTRFVKSTKASIALTSQEIRAEASRAIDEEGTLRASIKINADEISSEITRAKGVEGELSSSITQTSESISSEITRAQNAEYELSSQITQTASDISARVSDVEKDKLNNTCTNSSFGWSLTASGFYLNSNDNTRIFEANSSGIKISGNADITGKITATSGYIGNGANGFQINDTSITNGKASLDDNCNGVYIGTDGISLGRNFKVNSSGEVTASSLKLYGSLYFKDPEGGSHDISFSASDVLRILDWVNGNGSEWDTSASTVSEGAGGWNSAWSEVSEKGNTWTAGAEAAQEAKNWIDGAGNSWIGVGNIYGDGFFGEHYGSHYYPGSYGYIQSYLASVYIEGYGYLHYVAW